MQWTEVDKDRLSVEHVVDFGKISMYEVINNESIYLSPLSEYFKCCWIHFCPPFACLSGLPYSGFLKQLAFILQRQPIQIEMEK